MLRPKRAGAYSKQAGGKQATGERNDGGTLWCAMVRYGGDAVGLRISTLKRVRGGRCHVGSLAHGLSWHSDVLLAAM